MPTSPTPTEPNLYAYVVDNPLSFFDITGHHQECIDQPSSTDKDPATGLVTIQVRSNCHEVPDPLGSIGINTTIPTQQPQSITNLPTYSPNCPAVPPHPNNADVNSNISAAQLTNYANCLNPATQTI